MNEVIKDKYEFLKLMEEKSCPVEYRTPCKGIYMKGLAILENNRKWLKALRMSEVVQRNVPEKEIGDHKMVAGFAGHAK